jgi:hypothetical protein
MTMQSINDPEPTESPSSQPATPVITQVIWLFVLAMPVACISWTLTKEELIREVHTYLVAERSNLDNSLVTRKLCFLVTCHYCLSHYVALFFLILTRFQLLCSGFRGYLIAFFSVVWVANFYMVIFRNLVG